MQRYFIYLSYDGTSYHGWQVQPNGNSVQEELQRALSTLLREKKEVVGAGRTDAGVHALGNIAVFDTEARMPAEKYAFALNTRLPEDIRIQKSEEVAPDFHPRFCRTIKTYEYRILNRTFPDPTRRFNSVHIYGNLDMEAMQRAAACLEGTHDFKSFATENPQVTDTVRTIYKTKLWKEEDMIRFQITGNGFLYNMVRIIVGTLLEVGKGAIPAEEIPAILEAKDRTKAGPTARAKGLTLLNIRYPDEEESETVKESAKREMKQ